MGAIKRGKERCFMKRLLKNGLALVLCAAIVALGLSALLFSCHHCDG